MNSLETFYFPDTVLPRPHQLALALFFDTIHLLQPVEDGEQQGQDIAAAPGSYPFTESGFCQAHTPSRLGVDRDRFLHLLHDISHKKDAYVEQLSYLTLASLSAPAGRGENSKQAIMSSLLQDMAPGNEAQDEQERLALWQARLVLKIAELLDQEEEELTRQMATVDDREIALFRSLQGEIRESGDEDAIEEDPFAELLALKQKMNQPRPGMIKNRLRAWGRLYASGPLPVQPLMWLTRRQEAADILLEQYEQESGRAPVMLMQLELPVSRLPDQTAMSLQVTQFRTEMQVHLSAMAAALAALVTTDLTNTGEPAVLLPQAESWQEIWNGQIAASFPASHYDRTPLTIYLLAETSLPALLGQTQNQETPAPSRHALLAVWA